MSDPGTIRAPGGNSRWELQPHLVRPSRSPRRHRSSSSSPVRPKERRDEEKKELKDSKKERQITGEGGIFLLEHSQVPCGAGTSPGTPGFLGIPTQFSSHRGGFAGQDRGGDRDDEDDGFCLLRYHQGERRPRATPVGSAVSPALFGDNPWDFGTFLLRGRRWMAPPMPTPSTCPRRGNTGASPLLWERRRVLFCEVTVASVSW